MKDSDNKTIGALAFLGGVVIGALGLLAIKRDEEESDGTLDLTTEGKNDDAHFENITQDSSTLLDSLEGITVDGTEADLVKVRVLGLERAKLVAMWGTKGRAGTEPAMFRRFVDLTSEHLVNIKKNSSHVTEDDKRIINSILEDRVAAGEAEESVLDD